LCSVFNCYITCVLIAPHCVALVPVPQADATIKMGDNWKDPVTSHTPARSGTRVASVLAGRSPGTGVSLILHTGTKGSICFTIGVWYCE